MVAILAVASTATIYFLYEPQQYGFYLSCPLHSLTGLKCPLCGLQQMTHQILHGQFGAAFTTNPFLFSLIPFFFVYLYLNISGNKTKHVRLYRALYGDKTLLALLIVALVFGILRNL